MGGHSLAGGADLVRKKFFFFFFLLKAVQEQQHSAGMWQNGS